MSDSGKNDFRQFLDNVIQIPEEFLDYEKLEVWKKLKIRITDEDVRRDINEIWTRWTRLLLDRENRNSVEIVSPFSPSYTPSVPVAMPPFVRIAVRAADTFMEYGCLGCG